MQNSSVFKGHFRVNFARKQNLLLLLQDKQMAILTSLTNY